MNTNFDYKIHNARDYLTAHDLPGADSETAAVLKVAHYARDFLWRCAS